MIYETTAGPADPRSDPAGAEGWRCPTCSGTELPPSWVKVKAEWDALSEREREVGRHLLFGLRIYSSADFDGEEGPCRGWRGEISGAIRALLPSFRDAWEVTEDVDGVCKLLDPDEEDRWEVSP